MGYLAVIEPTRTGYSAYVPDLPGCVAAGRTRAEVIELITEAIQMHLEALHEKGRRTPRARTVVQTIPAEGTGFAGTPREYRAAAMRRAKANGSTGSGRFARRPASGRATASAKSHVAKNHRPKTAKRK
jgi:predicted RNase H-like HicB family nuclease